MGLVINCDNFTTFSNFSWDFSTSLMVTDSALFGDASFHTGLK